MQWHSADVADVKSRVYRDGADNKAHDDTPRGNVSCLCIALSLLFSYSLLLLISVFLLYLSVCILYYLFSFFIFILFFVPVKSCATQTHPLCTNVTTLNIINIYFFFVNEN